MNLLDSISALGELILSNIGNVLFLAVVVIVSYFFYKFVAREIIKLKNQKRLEEHIA